MEYVKFIIKKCTIYEFLQQLPYYDHKYFIPIICVILFLLLSPLLHKLRVLSNERIQLKNKVLNPEYNAEIKKVQIQMKIMMEP